MAKTFAICAFAEVKPDFVSRCIQKAIKANYSHIGILVGESTVYHATGVGFHKQNLIDMLEGGSVVIRRKVNLPIERECCALTWLEARIGTKYSLIQYLGFLFPWLRFIPKVSNGRRETVCSEIGADFAWDCVTPTLRQSLRNALECNDFVDPKQLMDILSGIYGEEPISNKGAYYGG